jgi:hypothetical protein
MIFRTGSINKNAINPMNGVIMIGDSNCFGYYVINDATGVAAPYLQTNPKAIIGFNSDFTTSGEVALENYSAVPTTFNRTPGYVRPTDYPLYYGWDAPFVKTVTDSTLRKLLVVKFGISGSTLISRTEPAREWQKSSGGLYYVFLNCYHQILDKLKQQQIYGIDFKVIYVQLGTNDTFYWNTPLFTAAIPLFVSNLRTDLGLPNIPIYWIQVRADLQTRPSPPVSGTVAAARLAIANAGTLGNSAYIPGFIAIDDYGTVPMQSDGTHYTDVGYNSIGLGEAPRYLALL